MITTPEKATTQPDNAKTTADQTFLVLVIWLKCYQRMRYFPGLDEVPDAVAGHIRTALGLPDSVAVGVEAVRSAARYRDYVRERLGVKYDAADVRGIAETAIRAAAVTKDNPADLINVALEGLLESGRELPGYVAWAWISREMNEAATAISVTNFISKDAVASGALAPCGS